MATLTKKSEPVRLPPNLERQAIWFTVALFLLICADLVHTTATRSAPSARRRPRPRTRRKANRRR